MLEQANKDNVFVGAVVVKNNEKYYVYKINAKSIYIGKEKTNKILNKWENRPIGKKWVDFIKDIGGEKIGYDEIKVSSEEIAKRDGFIELENRRKASKDFLGKEGKKLLIELIKMYRRKKNVLMVRNDFGRNKKFYIIYINPKDDKEVLLRMDRTYFFYNIKTGIYTLYDIKLHKKNKKVVFPSEIEIVEDKNIKIA